MERVDTGQLGENIFILFLRISVLVVVVLYVIFALLIVRQVDLMSKTLVTPVSPLLRALSIIHAGFAIGFVILIIAMLV